MFMLLRLVRAFSGMVAGIAVSQLFLLVVGLFESGEGIAGAQWEFGITVAVTLIFGMLFLKGGRVINYLPQMRYGSDHPPLASSIWRL